MTDHYLITGGAGFIGSNLADHYLNSGKTVTVFDNMSRRGSKENCLWLQHRHGARVRILVGDIRELGAQFQAAVEQAQVLIHLASQVAVTNSVANPREDFDINALGTFNVLEAARQSSSRPIVLFSSTNKVYGKMEDLGIQSDQGRYGYGGNLAGISESRGLDFHSPYGCSKGSADQYVRDYARVFGLRTVVFRQSCIYGPRQFGLEDQGWVAWFAIQAMRQRPVTIYGDGMQVRDVLFVSDLVAAYEAAVERIDTTSGKVYNVGGGPNHTLSLLELIEALRENFGYRLDCKFDQWRAGDQKVYISDISAAKTDLHWEPKVPVAEGLRVLVQWLDQDARTFSRSA